MFGNKKSNSSNDDDLQITTRSMKSDLEGGSNDFLAESNIKQELKKPESSDIKPKENVSKIDQEKPINSIQKKEGGIKIPTDLPALNKNSERPSLSANKNQFKEGKKGVEKTHADDFFPKKPAINEKTKKETLRTPEKENSLGETIKTNPNKPTSAKAMAGKKDYDEFFKDKIQPTLPPKPEEEEKSSNMLLIVILVVIIIIAIASGSYYYFFVINKPEPVEPPIEEPTTSFPIEPPVQPPVEETLPEKLDQANLLEIDGDKKVKNILFSPENPENLTTGFYSINYQGSLVSIKELPYLLEIELPEIIKSSSQNAWIYYNNLTTSPEISLVLEIEEENATEIKQAFITNEENLPNMISGIYSDPVEELLTDEKVVFKNSFDNAGFRYYNFKSTSPALTKSLDWGIIADEKILVIATSKEMATEISSQLLDNSPDFMETSTENEPSSTNSTLEDSSGDADADNSSYEIENSSSDLPSESLTDEKVLNNASVD